MQNKELSAANDPIPIPIPIPKPRDTPELQEQLSRAPNHQENDPERETGKGNPVCHNLGMLHPGRRIFGSSIPSSWGKQRNQNCSCHGQPRIPSEQLFPQFLRRIRHRTLRGDCGVVLGWDFGLSQNNQGEVLGRDTTAWRRGDKSCEFWNSGAGQKRFL